MYAIRSYYENAYQDRPKGTHTTQSSSGQNLGNVFSTGSSSQKSTGGLNLKSIITIAIIVIVGYFVLKSCMNIDLLDSVDMSSYDSSSSVDTSSSNDSSASSGTLDYEVSNDARERYTTSYNFV